MSRGVSSGFEGHIRSDAHRSCVDISLYSFNGQLGTVKVPILCGTRRVYIVNCYVAPMVVDASDTINLRGQTARI